MKGLAKGELYIRREELLDFLGLPDEAEMVSIKFDAYGNVEIVAITSEEINDNQGLPLTKAVTPENRMELRRRRYIENPYKPKGKEIW